MRPIRPRLHASISLEDDLYMPPWNWSEGISLHPFLSKNSTVIFLTRFPSRRYGNNSLRNSEANKSGLQAGLRSHSRIDLHPGWSVTVSPITVWSALDTRAGLAVDVDLSVRSIGHVPDGLWWIAITERGHPDATSLEGVDRGRGGSLCRRHVRPVAGPRPGQRGAREVGIRLGGRRPSVREGERQAGGQDSQLLVAHGLAMAIEGSGLQRSPSSPVVPARAASAVHPAPLAPAGRVPEAAARAPAAAAPAERAPRAAGGSGAGGAGTSGAGGAAPAERAPRAPAQNHGLEHLGAGTSGSGTSGAAPPAAGGRVPGRVALRRAVPAGAAR